MLQRPTWWRGLVLGLASTVLVLTSFYFGIQLVLLLGILLVAAVIGERVRLYQAVTLGARSFPADETGALIKGRPRHPIIEDDVVIYAGATVLGRITIGRGSTIGGNVWLTQSVPPHSNVSQALSRQS